jgi:hypothetical protein
MENEKILENEQEEVVDPVDAEDVADVSVEDAEVEAVEDAEVEAVEEEAVEAIDAVDAEESENGEDQYVEFDTEENTDSARKSRNTVTSSEYEEAVNAVVFGALAIALPFFAIIFSMLGSMLFALATAIVGVVFAVLATKFQKRTSGAIDVHTLGLSKAAKTLSLIGMIISIFALAWVTISIVMTILVLIAVVGAYVAAIVLGIIAAMSAV